MSGSIVRGSACGCPRHCPTSAKSRSHIALCQRLHPRRASARDRHRATRAVKAGGGTRHGCGHLRPIERAYAELDYADWRSGAFKRGHALLLPPRAEENEHLSPRSASRVNSIRWWRRTPCERHIQTWPRASAWRARARTGRR